MNDEKQSTKVTSPTNMNNIHEATATTMEVSNNSTPSSSSKPPSEAYQAKSPLSLPLHSSLKEYNLPGVLYYLQYWIRQNVKEKEDWELEKLILLNKLKEMVEDNLKLKKELEFANRRLEMLEKVLMKRDASKAEKEEAPQVHLIKNSVSKEEGLAKDAINDKYNLMKDSLISCLEKLKSLDILLPERSNLLLQSEIGSLTDSMNGNSNDNNSLNVHHSVGSLALTESMNETKGDGIGLKRVPDSRHSTTTPIKTENLQSTIADSTSHTTTHSLLGSNQAKFSNSSSGIPKPWAKPPLKSTNHPITKEDIVKEYKEKYITNVKILKNPKTLTFSLNDADSLVPESVTTSRTEEENGDDDGDVLKDLEEPKLEIELLTIMKGHLDSICDIKIITDKKGSNYLISIGHDCLIRFWDLEAILQNANDFLIKKCLDPFATLRGHTRPIKFIFVLEHHFISNIEEYHLDVITIDDDTLCFWSFPSSTRKAYDAYSTSLWYMKFYSDDGLDSVLLLKRVKLSEIIEKKSHIVKAHLVMEKRLVLLLSTNELLICDVSDLSGGLSLATTLKFSTSETHCLKDRICDFIVDEKEETVFFVDHKGLMMKMGLGTQQLILQFDALPKTVKEEDQVNYPLLRLLESYHLLIVSIKNTLHFYNTKSGHLYKSVKVGNSAVESIYSLEYEIDFIYLFVGENSGYFTVWKLECSLEGFTDCTPVHRMKAHLAQKNNGVSVILSGIYRGEPYLFTGGADSIIKVFTLRESEIEIKPSDLLDSSDED